MDLSLEYRRQAKLSSIFQWKFILIFSFSFGGLFTEEYEHLVRERQKTVCAFLAGTVVQRGLN